MAKAPADRIAVPEASPDRSSVDAQFTVIALAPNDWRGQWVNRQYLLSRLGQRHAVLYSMGAWTVWERETAPWKKCRPSI